MLAFPAATLQVPLCLWGGPDLGFTLNPLWRWASESLVSSRPAPAFPTSQPHPAEQSLGQQDRGRLPASGLFSAIVPSLREAL